MPLYDCMLLMKPSVRKEPVMDLVARVGRRVYQNNGVITDMKSFGTVHLAYGIKKLDGRHFQVSLSWQPNRAKDPFSRNSLRVPIAADLTLAFLLVALQAIVIEH